MTADVDPKVDYKAFIFALHPNHGILLLYCTRKQKKGPHYQVPGGHVDKEDFDHAEKLYPDIAASNHLLLACKIGAARELFEETGIDLRKTLDRLKPFNLRPSARSEADELPCEIKKRVFFSLDLLDEDFFPTESRYTTAMNTDLSHLTLKLSHEHQGFQFESSIVKAVNLLLLHSGGKVSSALRLAVEQGFMKKIEY